MVAGIAVKVGGKTIPRIAKAANARVPGIKNYSKQAAAKAGNLVKSQYGKGQELSNKLGDGAAKMLPGAEKGLLKTGVKAGARALPFLGSAVSATFAYQAFKRGDILGGLLNTVGAIPGPVGWGGMILAAAWDAFHHGGYGMWEAPDGTSTYMLPAAAKDVAGVSEVDAALTAAQRALFAFPDGPSGSVWDQHPPQALRLDGKEVEAAIHNWLTGIADRFARMEQTLASSNEPYAHQYREKLKPHFAAMAALPGRTKDIMAQLKAVSDHAGDAYTGVVHANKSARTQLANDGRLGDTSAANQLATIAAQAKSGIEAANDKLANMFGNAPAVLASSYNGAPAHPGGTNAAKADKPPAAPAAHAPGSAAPAAAEQPKKSEDNQVPKATSPGLGTPMSTPHTGGGGGTPMGSPGGGSHGGGTPMTANQPKSAREPNKLVDDKDAKDRKSDKPKLSVASRDEKGTGKPAAPGPAAAAPAAPGAQPPGKAQAPAAKPEESKQVDVKGRKTTFPDAKTAKMGQLLAGADREHPLSLQEAAAKAGLKPPVPGQDPGQQVAPAESRPGDILQAGEKRFMLLGDGQFYDLDQYKVVGASELPSDLGDRAGYFRLEDAGASSGPVSAPPQDGVAYPVPGGQSAPTLPVDGSAAPPGASVPADPASHPVPPPGSSGAPGLPRQGGAGPGNAAETATGRSGDVPSSMPTALDPSAIK